VPSANQVDPYAVVGNPVSHSLSPRIHASFAEQTGQRISYRAIEIPIDRFARGISELQHQGFRGANVTVPFKRQAWELSDRLSARARDAGAVNTLSFQPDGNIVGDNTDGVGLLRDLVDNLRLGVENRNLLILGAGGAVRGVLGPILAQAPRKLTLANRTLEKAVGLARDFEHQGHIQIAAFDALKPGDFDLIINATSAGLSNETPPIATALLVNDPVCYDMMYNLQTATAFVRWALDGGATQVFDGLGMLVEQAAEAFMIWRDQRPATTELIRSLRQS
jgi:shikimate dehydrogenase